MVVVEDGLKHMHAMVAVKVDRMIQTDAGKMLFAKIDRRSPAVATRSSRKRSGMKRALHAVNH